MFSNSSLMLINECFPFHLILIRKLRDLFLMLDAYNFFILQMLLHECFFVLLILLGLTFLCLVGGFLKGSVFRLCVVRSVFAAGVPFVVSLVRIVALFVDVDVFLGLAVAYLYLLTFFLL